VGAPLSSLFPVTPPVAGGTRAQAETQEEVFGYDRLGTYTPFRPLDIYPRGLEQLSFGDANNRRQNDDENEGDIIDEKTSTTEKSRGSTVDIRLYF